YMFLRTKENEMNRKKLICAALAAILMTACASNKPGGDTQVENTDTPSTEVSQTEAPSETGVVETWAEDPSVTSEVANAETAAVTVPVAPVPSPINGIDLSYYFIEIETGDSFMPRVTMYPETASDSDKGEIWTSSDTEVCTVDELGYITGENPGYATVTVKSAVNPAVFATVTVRVYDPDNYYAYGDEDDDRVRRIELTYNSIDMNVGDTDMPYVTMFPSYADDIGEEWSSSDNSVATVDGKGNITAIAPGYAVITVKSTANPKVFATVTVHVNGDIFMDNSAGAVPPSSEPVQTVLAATVPSDDFVTIDDDDEPGAVKQINLTFYSANLEIGQSVMPIVSMYPEDAYDKSESWSSSDENVATVDHNGNITAVGMGECIITVKSVSDPDVESNVTVRVKRNVSEPTYVEGILIVNKSYPLPSDYNPGVDPDAQAAVDELISAASAQGLNIYVSSGFRSYDRQTSIYNQYVETSGKDAADTYSARPGYSEHQTGLCFDLNTIDASFGNTPEYEWLKDNAHKYGFIIRFPLGKENITGYTFEPWHIRYLGVENATKVYESGLCLEEYLGVESKYSE
ncbi:MAG: D-alanyl-D-alanine carboxypeptidase family protein, partial [Oscillospiraceae bacterium]|nr:D-alanyl-D-alanine carboxypeptidase family protein [Oscillospiraceae bacterium]